MKDYKGFENITLEEVLAKSSNIGAYKIGMRVGTKRYMDYLRRFGFTQKTGITPVRGRGRLDCRSRQRD